MKRPGRLHQRPGIVVVKRQRALDRQRFTIVAIEARNPGLDTSTSEFRTAVSPLNPPEANLGPEVVAAVREASVGAFHLAMIVSAGLLWLGAAISGLPLLSMPAQTVRAILASVFHHLAEDGSLFQFTYGPRCPISLQVLRELGLKASFRRWVPLNLPPASVYRISRNSA